MADLAEQVREACRCPTCGGDGKAWQAAYTATGSAKMLTICQDCKDGYRAPSPEAVAAALEEAIRATAEAIRDAGDYFVTLAYDDVAGAALAALREHGGKG